MFVIYYNYACVDIYQKAFPQSLDSTVWFHSFCATERQGIQPLSKLYLAKLETRIEQNKYMYKRELIPHRLISSSQVSV